MPASVEEKEWLDAVAALENTGQWQTAAIGYVTALERWDKSFVAWIGLGNSKYNLDDLDASAEAFYQATLLQPENGMGFNNLAHVLAEQGKWQEALTSAQHAVDLGGPFINIFRQTLEEVKIMGMH
jgi:tetratricopeptide (TPR) repeat protein